MLYFLLGRVFSLFLLFTVADRMSCLVLFLGVFAVLLPPVPAPVPRCSPMIIINKVVEWNSLTSDRQNICAHLTPLTRFITFFVVFLITFFDTVALKALSRDADPGQSLSVDPAKMMRILPDPEH